MPPLKLWHVVVVLAVAWLALRPTTSWAPSDQFLKLKAAADDVYGPRHRNQRTGEVGPPYGSPGFGDWLARQGNDVVQPYRP